MTENTYQQIEILTPTQDEPTSCRLSTKKQCRTRKNQHAQFSHVAPRIAEEQASCRPKPLQGKRTKMRELLQKHTCDSELARAIEKVALAVLHARSCKRNVAMSSSLRLPDLPCSKACFARPSPLASPNIPSSRHMMSSGMPAFVPTSGAKSFPARRVIAICRRATACWSHNAGQWMCRILPAPRLEHNSLHAELSVTSSALTSSDKSDMRLFNPSVRQAHLTAP